MGNGGDKEGPSGPMKGGKWSILKLPGVRARVWSTTMIINGAEAMQHHTGLSNGFWIYAVKAKLHTYNITVIKQADYKMPKELWSSKKPNISHLQVFGCLAWVHILKKRKHKLEPKSWEMIFIGYEPGLKGYQFWDAVHQCFESSHDVKFKETQFPAKEMKLAQPILAPLSSHQIPELDNESDSLGLDLQSSPTSHKATQPRPICIGTTYINATTVCFSRWIPCPITHPKRNN